MGKFEEFNKAINKEQLKKDMKKAKENEYKTVPAGKYRVKIEKMEIGLTGKNAKTPNAPMFKVQARITEGEYRKQCLFMNKVLYVADETEKWNTGRAIQVVIGWLENIESETPLIFEDYDQFSDLILDLSEECEALEFEVRYDDNEFNSITILDVWEV